MLKNLQKSWFQARTLSVVQTYFEQPIHNPLPQSDAEMMSRAVRQTMLDGGSPHDAALRYFVALAEKTVRAGGKLDEIRFFHVLGRSWAIRTKMKFYAEHVRALKQMVGDLDRTES